MHRVLFTLFAILVFVPAQLSAQPNEDVTGYWLTENGRAVVHIVPCENSVCGSVYWIIEDGLTKDLYNPEESLRNRPICGLTILYGFENDGPGEWESGKIYKADDGDLYSANLTLQDDGQLRLRGYVGFSLFGKTQHWTRVNPDVYQQCVADHS